MKTTRCVLFVLPLWLLGVAVASGQIVSDDFNANNLKRTIWTYIDPQGDGTLTLSATGTANAAIAIAVPAGIEHQPWTGGYLAPRIMQAAPNTDFQIEVKFLSPVSQGYQIQGVLIEQDSTHFLRFDFSSDGSQTYVFAASFAGSYASPTVQIPLDSIAPAGVFPLYLRITRLTSTNTWSVSYSLNGTVYSAPSPSNFIQTLTVRKVGIFAGNTATSGNPPAHTALADYFFNTASPINPEDGGTPVDKTSPLVYNLDLVPGPSFIQADWKTDEAARATIQYGTTTAYGKTVSNTSLLTNHSMQIPGLQAGTLYHLRIISEDNALNRDTTVDVTAATVPADPPLISVWYGAIQTFGKVGTAQRYVDILGNVYDKDGIDSLYYRLNGGTRVNIAHGPDGRRLARDGDFVIDLTYKDLQAGANSLVIVARNVLGVTATTSLTVNDNSSSKVWPNPATVRWSAPASLQDSVQVIDGKWSLQAGGVRIMEPGYTREIAFGDTAWTDYQVTAEFTVNSIDSSAAAFGPQNGGPGLGFLVRWKGHTDQPVFAPPITQPKTGYLPLGSLVQFHWRDGFGSGQTNRWELLGNSLAEKDQSTANPLTYGVPYVMKVLVRTVPGVGAAYHFKAWRKSDAEPSGWFLNSLETLSDPQQGSILLLAHFVDVTFGQVSVVPAAQIPPAIFGVTASTSSTSAIIRWVTDVRSRSTLVYGLTTAYGDTIKSDGVYGYSRQVLLTNLVPASLYHYRVIATDSSSRVGRSDDFTFSTSSPPQASILVSDEFNSGSLNTSVWRATNPNPPGGASIGMTGVEAFLSLSSGISHDLSASGYNVPRIMQSANNTDFTVDIKCNAALMGSLASFQIEGVLVEQDTANLIRFDFNTGTTDSIAVLAASYHGGLGSPAIQVQKNIALHGSAPLYMRVRRESDLFMLGYSFDGLAWKLAGVFADPVNVTKVGVFAANPGSSPLAFSALFDYFRVGGGPVTVPAGTELPQEFALEQNYPNPFNPITRIQFTLPEESSVRLEVFNMLGQRVALLVDEWRGAGFYAQVFDASQLSSGVYFYRLRAGGKSMLKKMVLLK